MIKTIAIVLFLVQSVLGTEAQNVGPCFDTMLNSTKAGGNVCAAAEEYIRCVFVAMNFQSWSLSETYLTNLENALEQSVAANGIDCNIDIRTIVKKVTEDESNASTRTTKKPTGYNYATTIGDCLNTFTGASTQADSPNCSLVTPYLKCLIRVTGLYKYYADSSTYNDAYSSLEIQIETTFRSTGFFCNVDIKKLSAEVANEQNYRNSESGLHTSVRGMMSLYTAVFAVFICSYLFRM